MQSPVNAASDYSKHPIHARAGSEAMGARAATPYKVFLVEDEIVTREGIRDNVNWEGTGFVFCGEASDGEIALPLIKARQPDLLITDIKMPFMDGLQLSRIVRAQMPGTRIVILSGHDEFQYAREAISIGVSEYLLKPLGVHDLESLLWRIATELDAERRELQTLRELQARLASEQPTRRDRFLLRLLTVGASPAEAMAESHALGMDLVAGAYQVILVRVERTEVDAHSTGAHFALLERLHDDFAALAHKHSAGAHAPLVLRKDIDESALVLRAADADALQAQSDALLKAVRALHLGAGLRLRTGAGTMHARIHELNLSFSAALYDLHASLRAELSHELSLALSAEARGQSTLTASLPETPRAGEPGAQNPGAALVHMRRAALKEYLRTGVEAGFDAMFDDYMGAVAPAAVAVPAVRSYLLTDIVLTLAKFINQMGGRADSLFAEMDTVFGDEMPGDGATSDALARLRQRTREYCLWALDVRDQRAAGRNTALVQKAQHYIEASLSDSTLSLADVARSVSLSPNHFSTVFSTEIGETFRDYLTRMRMQRACELLRCSPMSNAEISEKVGYADAHYFGAVFKRVMGVTPQQYRNEGAPS